MKIEVMRRDFILAAIAYRSISEELREVASDQNSEKVTLLTSVQNELEATVNYHRHRRWLVYAAPRRCDDTVLGLC